MRICSWKEGRLENESNQTVILAANSGLRNRWGKPSGLESYRHQDLRNLPEKNSLPGRVGRTPLSTAIDSYCLAHARLNQDQLQKRTDNSVHPTNEHCLSFGAICLHSIPLGLARRHLFVLPQLESYDSPTPRDSAPVPRSGV